MKKIITLLFAIYLFQTNVFSQTTVYYDQNWEAVKNKANALYYSKHEPKNADGFYSSRDYYIDDSLQMTGSYTDDQYKTKEGNFVWYYHNGKRKSKRKYVDGKIVGKNTDYYDNGKIYAVSTYKNGKVVKKIYYNDNGNASIEYHYNNRGFYDSTSTFYYTDGSLYCNVNYNDTNRIKKEWFYPDGTPMYKSVYGKNITYHEKAYTDEGKRKRDSSFNYTPGKFGKGENDLKNYIKQNLKYPKAARDKDLEGIVTVFFKVDADGSISNIYIFTTEIYYLLADEAKRLVVEMPKDKWKPANLNGNDVPYFTSVNVTFEIDQ